MMRKQWYYRGSLNFCNYSCSYCPFAKKRYSANCLARDKQEWERFVSFMEQRQQEKHSDSCHGMDGQSGELGAVLVVPYGEALIHDYYWEGLARLSRLPFLEYVGAQSNFSFPIEKMLSLFEKCHGEKKKLRLWGTFHPEMVDLGDFLAACKQLDWYSLSYCVGAVGVPEQIDLLRTFRERLSQKHYLFINRMDGLKRRYREEEIAAFTAIDPYFPLELKVHKRGDRVCDGSYFVTANGDVFGCNISNCRLGNLYETNKGIEGEEKRQCSKRSCDCYLAYNNLHKRELLFFEPYPAFRIPDYKKALFFDVDGTLVPDGQALIPEERIKQLSFLSKHTRLFLATSLPYEIAMRKLNGASHLFSGGVFANGGRVIIKKDAVDVVFPMDDGFVKRVKQFAGARGFRCHTYQRKELCYKITLREHRGRGVFWSWKEERFSTLRKELSVPEGYVMLLEDNCLQITAEHTGKLNGILFVLRQLGWNKEDIGFFGNGDNDVEALRFFPFSVAAEGSSEAAWQAAGNRLWENG